MNTTICIGIIACILAYGIGNIAFSVMVGRLAGYDLYSQGSKNPGASNVARVAGWKWGALALTLDLLKGFVPTLAILLYSQTQFPFQTTRILGFLVAGAAMAGHVIPIGRKGGKGIATGAGAVLALFPLIGISVVAVWIVTIKITKLPVVSSITAAAVLPLWLLFDHNYMWEFYIAAGLFSFVVLRHLPNIIRLVKRQENLVTKQGREQYKQKS